MTLSMLLGTPLEPDLSSHVLLVEEVSEYLYAFDRAFFHVASYLGPRGLAGLRLGRVSDVPENDRPFGTEAEAIARYWCERSAIPWLGRARSEEHTSEIQSLMRISYAVFCLQKKRRNYRK